MIEKDICHTFVFIWHHQTSPGTLTRWMSTMLAVKLDAWRSKFSRRQSMVKDSVKSEFHMDVEPKIGGFSTQTIHFNRVWNHYKPSILGENPYFWKHPHGEVCAILAGLVVANNFDVARRPLMERSFGRPDMLKNIDKRKGNLRYPPQSYPPPINKALLRDY